MKKVPVAHFTVECELLLLMDGAVKNYIRSADYTEMQKSAVIYFSRHFLSTWQKNLTILIVTERVKMSIKINDCACLCCKNEYVCNFEREFLVLKIGFIFLYAN